MITVIPNQPIAFDDSRIRGCCSLDPEDCLLVDNTDSISWQVGYSKCVDDEEQLTDPGFDTGDGWDTNGWIITQGQACLRRPPFGGTGGQTLQETSFTPNLGSSYDIEIVVDSSTTAGGVNVYLGGLLVTILYGPGTYIGHVTAISTAGLSFVSHLNPGESICIESAEVVLRSSEYTVEFVDMADNVVLSIESADGLFAENLNDDRLTIRINLGDEDIELPDGCYTIQFTDNCSDTTFISQCVNIGTHACTIMLKACANGELLGFKGGFSPQMRVVADLKRPTFEYEYGEEKLSNGRLNRYYAERTRTMELRIGRVGEFAHNFLSSLPLWDHFYIGQEEYVVTSNTYEPGYEDVYSATGTVLLNVTPFEEDARKVRCVEDNAGCSPPPNYWVQGTGPNEDYILQEETGHRILIN